MAKIYGSLGSFSELKKRLEKIYRPNNLKDIIDFKNNLPKAPSEIKVKAEKEILEEIDNLRNKLKELSIKYKGKINDRKKLLTEEKNDIALKINIYSVKPTNIFRRLYYYLKLKLLLKRKNILDNHFDEEKRKPFLYLEKKILSTKEELDYKEKNLEKLIEKKIKPEIERLNTTNSLLLKNNKLYKGALGEEKVLDELRKLPDSFSVINNFKKSFSKGIYRKRTDDWIYSVQIDHIVIGPTGIFIIETKNWSQRSINNEDLFSPVRQVGRANHALYCYLNNLIKKNYLPSLNHRWGPLKISLNSIVVSIQEPLQQEFQHVKVLSLQGLFSYITHRKQIFSKNQIEELTKFLSEVK